MKFEMRKKNAKSSMLLTAFIAILLFTSTFTAIPALSVQPPLDTATYYKGTIGQPSRLDPARAYDTASCELIQNVYETLIWYADTHPITFTPDVGYNLTQADYADLTKFKPVLSTFVPNQTNGGIIADGAGGSYWSFSVNEAATWQTWIAADGSTIPSRALTAYDVVWSFRRQMVLEMSSSPAWMWFMPAFGIMGFSCDNATYPAFSNGTFTSFAVEDTVRDMIQGFVYQTSGTNVTFHFQYAWAPVVMYQIFSQTWGSIMNPEFCIEHGDWDGSFANGWSNWYRRKPSSTASALDRYKDPAVYGASGSLYNTGNHDVPTMLGTGPYNFTSTNWDPEIKTWRIDKWTGYWRGWAGNHVTTVIVRGVDAWPTRKMLFLEGEFDEIYVPRASIWDLLATGKYSPISGVNLVYDIPQLANEAIFFTMNVTSVSPFQSYLGYPQHVSSQVPYFFNDSHIRKAFAWAFDYTTYISVKYEDEAVQQASWWVDGLAPPDYKNTNIPLRDLNLTEMQNELNQAIIEGFNVSETGFETTLVYNLGNDMRKIACEMIAEAFSQLGPRYKVNVAGLDWPLFLDLKDSMAVPAYALGWLGDSAYVDNFARAYMHSLGAFPVSQGPPFPADQSIIDAEIDAALVEPDYLVARAMYRDLQSRYWEDVISFTLVQPTGRRWARDWVYGWYFNSLYPGFYYYDLYKQVGGTAQPVNLDVIHTLTPVATWNRVYWFDNGTAIVGYTEGSGPANGTRAIYKFSLSIDRTDANTNVPSLVASVALKRLDLNNSNPSSNLFFTSVQQTIMAPGETKILSLDMEEDGTYATSFPGNHTFQLSAIAGVYSPGNAYDNNPTDNSVTWGTFKAQGPLTGDIKIDGVVNILDSIVLGLKFNLKAGIDLGYDVLCDLKLDGWINILDAQVLGLNFAKTAPGPQYP